MLWLTEKFSHIHDADTQGNPWTFYSLSSHDYTMFVVKCSAKCCDALAIAFSEVRRSNAPIKEYNDGCFVWECNFNLYNTAKHDYKFLLFTQYTLQTTFFIAILQSDIDFNPLYNYGF